MCYKSVLFFEIFFLSLLFFYPPFCELSELTKDYDIWGDNAVSGFNKEMVNKNENRYEQIYQTESVDESPLFVQNKTRRKGRIISFFYPSSEYECKAEDGRRAGLCLNTYRCHRRGGTSSGSCALGFGVCCVFTVSCGQEIKDNITYFVSPEFPSLSRSIDSCTVQIRKMEGASQLRLDFIHFNLGQPNRLTGECDSDLFTIAGANTKDFKLCGFNSGQHIYYDIDKSLEYITMDMRLTRPTLQRMWEIRVSQVRFGQRAPAGCLQYYTSNKGFIQTLNYAENGRHLADQDYKSCIRQEKGMCSILYEPCDDDSFRIGPSLAQGTSPNGNYPGGISEYSSNTGGSVPVGGGAPAGGMSSIPGMSAILGALGMTSMPTMTVPGMGQQQQPIVADQDDDAIDGSGDGAPPVNTNRLGRQFTNYNPYAQHLGERNVQNSQSATPEWWRYWGYGNYGQGVSSFGRQMCQDRIITPCDADEFLGGNAYNTGFCDPYHCGSTLCPGMPSRAITGANGPICRIETSVTPFEVGIKFGPPTPKYSPEDNIGVCLKYEQIACG